jgi:D-amino peptidase
MKLHSIATTFLAILFAIPAFAADKPIKTFICAGQSNMVGWGDSTKLPVDLRKGNDRVLMFEDGKWQPLRPHAPAFGGQKNVGLTEFHFGPEIAFGHEMARAWPNETIGIIKFSIGGTSVLAWKPDWSKEDADRVGQGRHGSLYKKLMEKVAEASKDRDIDIVGFLWLQGGGDTKNADVAKEYLDNLKSVVATVRENTGVADLPFLYGTTRIEGIPDDLTNFEEPKNLPPGRPGAWLVLKAQFDAQKAIPNSKMVILRDIEKHPRNVHYNTAGQLVVGKLFADAFLEHVGHGFKVYISTDMEGCSGVTCSEQVAGEEGEQLLTGDMNACIEGCFAAGATEVVVRDHHSSGSNVDPQAIDQRAKLIQGKTPENRFKDIEGSDAMILLGYHAMALTPNGTLAHSFSSASIQGMWLNGREVGEIGVDAAIAAEYKVPVVMVSGDDKCCAEARSWLPGVVTCQTKVGTGPQSADILPLKESRRLITQKTKEALSKRKEIRPIKIKYPATIRWDYLPKGSPRTHNPAFKPVENPRRVERTGDSVEALLLNR